ncbi:nucleic acid binding [Mactra antiquata]
MSVTPDTNCASPTLRSSRPLKRKSTVVKREKMEDDDSLGEPFKKQMTGKLASPVSKRKLAAVKKEKLEEAEISGEPVKKKARVCKRKSVAVKKEKTEDGESSSETVIKKENQEIKKDCDKENITSKKATTSKVKTKTLSTEESLTSVSWQIEDIISENLNVPKWAATNVVKLLDEGCTIPFIARYRKEQTGGMEVQKLRDTCTALEELRSVENKVKAAKAAIHKVGKLTKQLDTALSNAVTATEVECLFAPFKPGNKGTLAERAKALGLEPLAEKFLAGTGLKSEADMLINKEKKGLKSTEEIMNGIIHIIADKIHKHPAVMEQVRQISSHRGISICSSEIKQSTYQPKPGEKLEPAYKYQDFFDYSRSIGCIQHHQVLAMNRGENNKVLKIKIDIPQFIDRQVMKFCCNQLLHSRMNNDSRNVLEMSVKDAYTRLIQPQITRLVRTNLTKSAEKASIEVFATNLKNLLLSAPLKGCTILALDPGFSNGCKSAVISKTGQIVDTAIFYLHGTKNKTYNQANHLHDFIMHYSCDIIAIGNGVGCRETEIVVSDIIKRSSKKLQYCIVSESGASIYSVSDAANKEMPELDPSLRGAVSIGRRLLDPLSEYVKFDPKHLGVGQYQHDMPQNLLKSSLDSVIEECVSFVGVDVNTCSECLLSHISGLSAARAKKIVEFRDQFGPFICREQLLSVKGLGAKTYEQAAGFIRIHSKEDSLLRCKDEVKVEEKIEVKGRKGKTKTVVVSEYTPEPLDRTWIHPESYQLAYKLMKDIDVSVTKIGTPDFINKVKNYISQHDIEVIGGEQTSTVKLILDALVRPLSYDLRDEFDKPLFKSGVKCMKDLEIGHVITGKVTNMTNFGAFVDIGVERAGLIHISNIQRKGFSQLKLGDKVEVKITDVNRDKGRIGLDLRTIL